MTIEPLSQEWIRNWVRDPRVQKMLEMGAEFTLELRYRGETIRIEAAKGRVNVTQQNPTDQPVAGRQPTQ